MRQKMSILPLSFQSSSFPFWETALWQEYEDKESKEHSRGKPYQKAQVNHVANSEGTLLQGWFMRRKKAQSLRLF